MSTKRINLKDKFIVIICFLLMIITACLVIVCPVKAETDYTGVLHEINDRVSDIQNLKESVTDGFENTAQLITNNNQMLLENIMLIANQFDPDLEGSFTYNIRGYMRATTDSFLILNRTVSSLNDETLNIKNNTEAMAADTQAIHDQLEELNILTVSGNECLAILSERAETDLTNAELMEELNTNLLDLNERLAELSGYMAYFFGFMILIIVVVSFKAVWYYFDKYILKHSLL